MTIAQLVDTAAETHRLSAALVRGVALMESSGDTWAFNPEPEYRYLWDLHLHKPFRRLTSTELACKTPPADFTALPGIPIDAEWWGQQTSWGLMQVMGGVAREHGFRGRFLSALCDPALGLDFGCRVLADRLRWSEGDVRSALAAYNGGKAGNAPGRGVLRNGAYADRVLALMA